MLSAFIIASGCRTKAGPVTYTTAVAAAQAAVSERLDMPVLLQVDMLNQHGGWVFLSGLPLTTERQRIDYTDTSYATDIAEGYFDDNYMALVRRLTNAGDSWHLVELSIGATDAPFVDWFERYQLPLDMAAPATGPGGAPRQE